MAEQTTTVSKLAREGMMSLIILDIMMPRMDGFQVATEIRRRSGAPIVCLSAITDSATKATAIVQFADDYLTKPCDYRELTARIRRILTYYPRKLPVLKH